MHYFELYMLPKLGDLYLAEVFWHSSFQNTTRDGVCLGLSMLSYMARELKGCFMAYVTREAVFFGRN